MDLFPSQPGWYKGCAIADTNPINNQYILVTAKIPPPVGGQIMEIAEMDGRVISLEPDADENAIAVKTAVKTVLGGESIEHE
jgi:hypothetical protein